MKLSQPNIYLISKSINEIVLSSISELYKEKLIKVVTTPEVLRIVSQKKWPNFLFINENQILDKEKFQKKLSGIESVGWYYQQFLKYHTVLSAPENNVHIVDGDSIVKPLWSLNGVLATTGKLAYPKYTVFSELVLNHECNKYSFVTNQMVFNKELLKQMIFEIELIFTDQWENVFIGIMKNNGDAMFSEYQLYGNYVLMTQSVELRKMKVFRRMDRIKADPKIALDKYDLIAYEPQHKTGILRHLRANIYYRMGFTLG